MEVDQVSEDEVQRWNGLRNVYMRESPFTLKTYAPSPIVALNIQEAMNILVVGAGGLGCEILKLLALSGFTSITVIDLDTVDISNLNRQFLFRRQHVGQPKAKVAAEHIKRKYPHVNVDYETKPLETFPLSFYSQFNLVIAGLDNVKARQNLNRILNDMVKFKADGTPDWSTVIPLIDGGTEGLRGQARLFLPKITSCFECSLQTLVVDENKPELSCTLATVPRNASHCIQYVKEELWDYLEEFKSASEYKMYLKKHPNDEYKPKAVALDKDDPQHLQWICNLAAERAAQFKIEGVTFKLTMQVVKNIIPAVASTNAIIAAACVAEAIKVLTGAAPLLDNYMFFNGIDLPGCSLYSYEKIPTCEVCQRPLVLKLSRSTTVADLQTRIQQELKLEVKPDLSAEEKLLYLSSQHSAFADNLTQTLHTLFPDKAPISVIATFYKRTRRVLVYLE